MWVDFFFLDGVQKACLHPGMAPESQETWVWLLFYLLSKVCVGWPPYILCSSQLFALLTHGAEMVAQLPQTHWRELLSSTFSKKQPFLVFYPFSTVIGSIFIFLSVFFSRRTLCCQAPEISLAKTIGERHLSKYYGSSTDDLSVCLDVWNVLCMGDLAWASTTFLGWWGMTVILLLLLKNTVVQRNHLIQPSECV